MIMMNTEIIAMNTTDILRGVHAVIATTTIMERVRLRSMA